MNVAIVVESGRRRVDAVADHARSLMSALRGAGAEVALIDRSGGRWQIDDGCGARGARASDAVVQMRGADWVVLEYSPFGLARWGFAPWVIWLAYRASRVSHLAVFVHEPYLEEGDGHRRLISHWQRFQLRAVLHFASAAAASISAWRDLVARLNPRIPVAHLPVGSNLPDRRAGRLQRRARLGAGDELVIAMLSTGHDSRLQDHVRLAVATIAERTGSVLALNLGAGAPELQAPDGVRIISPGWLDAETLAEHLAASDLFLSPLVDGASTRRTSIAAALQHGLPVVTTDGHLTDPELRAPISGLRLAPANDRDAFAELAATVASEPAMRADLSRRARDAYDQRWTWERIVRDLVHLLDHA
jgi:glycosyltransferase involved in cell wall biosynthesis